MKSSILRASAILALLAAAGVAHAQQSTTTEQQVPQAQTQPSAGCPAPGTVPEAQLPEECKPAATTQSQDATQPAQQEGATTGTTPDTTGSTTATDTTTAPTPPATTTEEAATQPAAPVGQSQNVFLASNFIGQTVYSANDENIGDINDLVVSKDQGAPTAIIGVGGFLGIGEKDVAVPISEITVTMTENNTMRLKVSMTREQLEAAPVFDRTAMMNMVPSTGATGTTGTTGTAEPTTNSQ